MTAIELLLYWVCPVIALTYIIGYSLIFEPIRAWSKWPDFISALMDCPMCIGFWVGIVVGVFNWLPVAWPSWVQYPVVGAGLAVTCEYLLEVFARERE